MTFKSRQNTRINNTSKGQELIRHRRTKDPVPWANSVPLRSLEMCPALGLFPLAGTLEQFWTGIILTKFCILTFISWPRAVSGVLEMKTNTTAGCQFLQWKFVVVLRGLCVFGIRKVVFFPSKNKLNVKSFDSIQALFINTACINTGEKKNPVFVK